MMRGIHMSHNRFKKKVYGCRNANALDWIWRHDIWTQTHKLSIVCCFEAMEHKYKENMSPPPPSLVGCLDSSPKEMTMAFGNGHSQTGIERDPCYHY